MTKARLFYIGFVLYLTGSVQVCLIDVGLFKPSLLQVGTIYQAHLLIVAWGLITVGAICAIVAVEKKG